MDEVSMLNNIIVKKTATDLFVPIKNDIYLHSAYDPIKEADNFLEKHRPVIAEKKDILILGLGFGYHVDAITEYCNTLSIIPSIYVLEPDFNLVELANTTRSKKYCNTFSHEKIEDLFSNIDFIALLMRKPYLIPHGPSITSNEKYFKHFLTYQANKKLNEIADDVINIDASMTLKSVTTLEQLESHLLGKNQLTANDFLLMSFLKLEAQGKNL
jgi:hypothetical protein